MQTHIKSKKLENLASKNQLCLSINLAIKKKENN